MTEKRKAKQPISIGQMNKLYILGMRTLLPYENPRAYFAQVAAISSIREVEICRPTREDPL